jgi:cyclopropane fatty-acyl-phospholipid synthase-like methyltransferase
MTGWIAAGQFTRAEAPVLPAAKRSARTAVRDYYDANTWKFLLTGDERAIHRELWGPGVTSRGEAVHHTHAVVLDQLGPGERRVPDLGCGVGTAARYLARRRPVEVVGVSISPAQIRLADRFAGRGGPLQGRVRFAVADFTALPSDLPNAPLRAQDDLIATLSGGDHAQRNVRGRR